MLVGVGCLLFRSLTTLISKASLLVPDRPGFSPRFPQFPGVTSGRAGGQEAAFVTNSSDPDRRICVGVAAGILRSYHALVASCSCDGRTRTLSLSAHGRFLMAGTIMLPFLWTRSTRCWSARLNSLQMVLQYSKCGVSNVLKRVGSVSASFDGKTVESHIVHVWPSTLNTAPTVHCRPRYQDLSSQCFVQFIHIHCPLCPLRGRVV